MRIAVIGAGLAGVAAAHALAREGHAVVVFERRASVAEEGSFAPPGIAAPALAAPWLAAPGRWPSASERRARELPREVGQAFAWPRLLRAPDPAPTAAREQRAELLHRLLSEGAHRVEALMQDLRLEWEHDHGLLLTLDEPALQARVADNLAWLKARGSAVESVDGARQQALEPGRRLPEGARTAVWMPGALVGNTREWAQLLRLNAQQLGTRFLFQHEVTALVPGPRPRVQALDRRGANTATEAEFDAVVVCAALDAGRLLVPLGLRLPLRPAHGASVTVPLHLREAAPHLGPRCTVLDARTGISIGRLGARMRVAGPLTEGPAPEPRLGARPSKSMQALYAALDDAYPGAALWPQAQAWQGTVALLPDGLPVVGASGLPGLWLDLGHGLHGLPLTQVAADSLCAMIAGRPTPVDIDGLGLQRWH